MTDSAPFKEMQHFKFFPFEYKVSSFSAKLVLVFSCNFMGTKCSYCRPRMQYHGIGYFHKCLSVTDPVPSPVQGRYPQTGDWYP